MGRVKPIFDKLENFVVDRYILKTDPEKKLIFKKTKNIKELALVLLWSCRIEIVHYSYTRQARSCFYDDCPKFGRIIFVFSANIVDIQVWL